jgi:succinate-semialdehyde dehydrogenase/glutarate-semialdehyde dehydrogenase
VPVGKHLMKLAADTMKRTTMELGGHAPVIVFDDADQERTLDMMANAKWRNCGQVCVSPTRYYVQERVYDKFVEGFVARAKAVKVGDGLEDSTQMGPMANPRRPEAIQMFIEDAVKAGAKVRAGGKRIGNQGFFHEPTIITDAPLSARIMNEEPFGPVAIVSPFATFEEVVKQANRLPYGLAGYAFTQSNRTAMLIGDALEVGMVAINTDRVAASDSPFGGVKESGHGAEEGPEGLEACLVTKTIMQH